MNTTTMVIIACMFGGCLLLTIPLSLLFKKKKGAADAFKREALQAGAVLNFYGSSLKIDGSSPVKGQDYVLGGGLERVIRLYPGTHKFSARFTITDARVGGSKSFKTDKIEFELSLEQGTEYTIGLYDDPGQADKTVFMMEMYTAELLSRKKYLVCEKV